MNAKCKKFLTMLLLVCVSIGAAGCSAYSNQRYYERAQLMMGSGEYAEARSCSISWANTRIRRSTRCTPRRWMPCNAAKPTWRGRICWKSRHSRVPTGICAIWMRWTRKTRANLIPR